MSDDDHGGEKVCYLDDIVAGHPVDPETRRDVARFRKAERERLYGLRKGLSIAENHKQAQQVAGRLDLTLPDVADRVIALYWPIRGELDLRDWMVRAHQCGARIALPVVVAKDAPLAFHLWEPGTKMTRGIWNIPVPAEPQPVTPDIVISPLVGVDQQNFRLGNGGGYYDRTLAALPVKPLVIGVGHHFCRIGTIFPQPWDIVMDQVILAERIKL
jgi:5-formyltetrahydrofolate cyclo-ligase